MNTRFLLFALPLSLLVFPVRADNPKALPVDQSAQPLSGDDGPKALPVDDSPPANAQVAAPAFVNSVTFKIQSEGETHVLTVISGPTRVRIDEPTDRLSVIYDPQTEYYIGLEQTNDTYWDFTWPKVRDEVQASQRYAARLRDIGPEALSGDSSAPAAADTDTPPVSSTAGTDDSGYIWHSTLDKKRIAGLDCVHWVGETLAGENIDAWCANGLLPQVAAAVATLRAINEPMALVPVRNFVPPLVFVAWDAMTKGGVTPVLISWGSGSDENRFALTEQKTRAGKVGLFEVPKIYMKTTLVTMDGIGNQTPVSTHRGGKPARSRVDSALP
jgi:hypothetical protein